MKSELSGPFIEDTDGNVNVLKDLMVEEEHETPEDPYGFDVIPMEEYIEKVEGVIQAQAAG